MVERQPSKLHTPVRFRSPADLGRSGFERHTTGARPPAVWRTIPITRSSFAGVAQLVEHFIGKDIRGCCNKWQEVTSPTVNGVSERHLLTSRFPRNWRKVGGNFLMQVLPRKLCRIFCNKVHSDCRLHHSPLPIPGAKERLAVIDSPRLRPPQFDGGRNHNEDFAEILQNV